MSDVQLATGIAILVSGYSQLHCGLSCYHWKVVGRLAWFSSLTHLSCLTLLRNYLHNHLAERQWRILFMFILIVMLVIAMVPTGNYTWFLYYEINHPQPSDYAICYFSIIRLRDSMTSMSMISMVLLISVGFAIRVVKLHKPLSVLLVGKPRQRLSNTIRKFLWIIYHWREDSALLPRRISGMILYFPALALFLTLRVILDHWSSMFFEACMTLTLRLNMKLFF